MTHDWTVLIMWATSLGVTLWGQKWKARADHLQDVITYMVDDDGDKVPDKEVSA